MLWMHGCDTEAVPGLCNRCALWEFHRRRRTAARGPVLPEPDRDGDGTHPWGLSAGAHDQEGPVYRRGQRTARGRRATVVPASGGDEWSGALPARGSWGGDRGDPALFGRHT